MTIQIRLIGHALHAHVHPLYIHIHAYARVHAPTCTYPAWRARIMHTNSHKCLSCYHIPHTKTFYRESLDDVVFVLIIPLLPRHLSEFRFTQWFKVLIYRPRNFARSWNKFTLGRHGTTWILGNNWTGIGDHLINIGRDKYRSNTEWLGLWTDMWTEKIWHVSKMIQGRFHPI